MMEFTDEEYRELTNAHKSDRIVSPAARHLRNIIEHQGMTQKEASEAIGLDVQRLRDVIYGFAPITIEECQILANWSELTLSFWANLEFKFRLKLHKKFGDTSVVMRTSNWPLEKEEERRKPSSS